MTNLTAHVKSKIPLFYIASSINQVSCSTGAGTKRSWVPSQKCMK
jgi:hypothetical protein